MIAMRLGLDLKSHWLKFNALCRDCREHSANAGEPMRGRGTRSREFRGVLLALLGVAALVVGCGRAPAPATPPVGAGLQVLAVEAFLGDIAQNVAGSRTMVATLIPLGVDPHAYEPTPGDLARVADSHVLIVNGAGLEAFLDEMLRNAGGERLVIEASAGLTSRQVPQGQDSAGHAEGDPHFWLDPTNVIRYVENIRAGLSQADPAGATAYAASAQEYIARLKELDQWIAAEVRAIPEGRRLLVTNHESLGYYADRYGFRVVGSIIPSVSTGASPSARQLAELVDAVKASGAPAVFLETGSNPQLAEQLARETGIRVVTQLYTHSPGPSGGPAAGYIGMMEYDTRAIVDALQ
jgi:ABC-type Zn uptake system ZnuABC Zn-binding protein ZnuA